MKKPLTIAFGCDHGGFTLKADLMAYLKKNDIQVIDHGTNNTDSVDYPDYAIPACQDVVDGKADFALLLCGTGLGMEMTANKVDGIRCALLSDTFSAHATREHNNANALAMGGRVLGPELAIEILDTFLRAEYSGDQRHQRRIDKMMALEEK